MARYRDMLEAPRWAGGSRMVKDLAWAYGLKLDIEIDKGWIRETVRFAVEGDDQKVINFKRQLYEAIDDYQRRVQSA